MRNSLAFFLILMTCLNGLWFSGCAQRPVKTKVDIDRRVDVAIAAASKYLQVGDTDNAHRHLARALELKPRHAPIHNALALLYANEQDAKKTEQSYKKALRFDSNYAPALNNYGTFLYDQGRLLEAKQVLEKAASDVSYNNRHLAYENLGLVALKLNDKAVAAQAFNNALRSGRPAPRALLELADIHYSRRQYRDAKRYLDGYIALEKHGPRSLYLGIGIAKATGDRDTHASYALALKNLFPNSLQYKQFRKSQRK